MMINEVHIRKSARYFLLFLLALFFVIGTVASLPAQEIQASQGMVASAHPLASQAGLEILKKGGNAVDAALATAFALSVVEPNASGLGGGGFMVIRMADGSPAVTIDFREMAPGLTDTAFYYRTATSFDSLTRSGPYSIGVPGVAAGAELVLKKFGTLPLSEILKPAIRIAREGFEVSENLSSFIMDEYEMIQKYPATAAIFLKDGLPLMAGASLKNPDLASTYERLAEFGLSDFYQGTLAGTIVNGVRSAGGILTLDDLKKYQAIPRKPVTGSYRGYQIISTAPPTGGGTHLVEMLNVIERFDLSRYQQNSADYIHLLAETMKMVFADKNENMADPAFYEVPVQELTDKTYAAKLQGMIDMQRASFEYQAPQLVVRESGSTTHLSVVDKDRNVVALTQSLNQWFGSGITVEGTGILLNNHLRDFLFEPGKPNSIEPYKRPVSSIAPTILLKDGNPFLTIGTPGGTRIISALAQIIINIVDFTMSMDEAIEAPRVHAYGKILYVEGRIPGEVIAELELRGHKVRKRADYDHYFGGAQGIMIKYPENILVGGADSRRDGVAVGY
ncbi:MAG: gamma-glutamyltransferase [Calditrichia bacterium]